MSEPKHTPEDQIDVYFERHSAIVRERDKLLARVRSLEEALGQIETACNRAANGSLEGPGYHATVGGCKAVLRAQRDIARSALARKEE